MDIRQAFRQLNIEKTTDEKTIRTAYHNELQNHHPEEDPEGFKTLREAYEEAVKYAQNPEDKAAETADQKKWDTSDAVGNFMHRMADLYIHFDQRIDPCSWEELLKDPVMTDFEREEILKKEIFLFLLDHFRLPVFVWKKLDRFYFFEVKRKDYLEFLPEEFVDFMIDRLRTKEDTDEFLYEAVSGYPEEDKEGVIDSFIGELVQAIQIVTNELFSYEYVNEQEYEKAKQETTKEIEKLISGLEENGIRHPYFTMLQIYNGIRSCNKQTGKDAEKDDCDISKIERMRADYPKDSKLILLCFAVFHEGKFDEELEKLCAEILNAEKENTKDEGWFGAGIRYLALIYRAQLAMERSDYKAAFRSFQTASELGYNSITIAGMEKSGKYLKDLLEEQSEYSDDDKNLYLQVCLRANLVEQGLHFLEAHPEMFLDTPKYHYNMACMYNEGKDYDKALNECEALRNSIDLLEEKDRAKWSADRHLLEAKTLINSVKEMQEEAGVRKEALNRASVLLQNIDQYETEIDEVYVSALKIELLRERKEDSFAEELIAECEKLLEKVPDHYYALASLQAAYQMKKNAQKVVDLYYQAKNVWDKDPEIYERAAEVFLDYNQYEDVRQVLAAAREAGAENTPKLRMFESFTQGLNAKSMEEWNRSLMELHTIAEENKNANPGKERDIGYSFYYLARLYEEPELLKEEPEDVVKDKKEKAAENFEKSLEYWDITDAHYRLGVLYLEQWRNFEEDKERAAYEQLKTAADRGYKSLWLYWNLANLSERVNHLKDAIHYLKYVVEEDEESTDEISRIGSWYQILYSDTGVEEYGDEAIRYSDLSDEKFGEKPATFYDRGKVYYKRRELEKTIFQFTRMLALLEDEEDEIYRRRLEGTGYQFIGQSYEGMRMYEDAVQNYEKAVEAFDQPKFSSRLKPIYIKIGNCYKYGRRKEEGISFFEKRLKAHYGNDLMSRELTTLCYEKMAWICFYCGDAKKGKSYLIKRCHGKLAFSFSSGKKTDWVAEEEKLKAVGDIIHSFPQALSIFEKDFLLAGCRFADAKEMPASQKAGRDLSVKEISQIEAYAKFMTYLGKYMIISGMEIKDAYGYLNRALTAAKLIEDDYTFSDWSRIYEWMAWAVFLKKDQCPGNLDELEDQYLAYWTKMVDLCEEKALSLETAVFHSDWDGKKADTFTLAQWYFLKGDIEKLRAAEAEMRKSRTCSFCNYAECFEHYEVLAWIAYLEGDYGKAEELCHKVNRIDPELKGDEALVLLGMLEKRGK